MYQMLRKVSIIKLIFLMFKHRKRFLHRYMSEKNNMQRLKMEILRQPKFV